MKTKSSRQGVEQNQTITPPPSTHKRHHRAQRALAPKLIMQNDQNFGQPEFTGALHQNDFAAFPAASDEAMRSFGYPFSAPVTAPPNFWDASMPMDYAMDLDTIVNNQALFQAAAAFPTWSSDGQSYLASPIDTNLLNLKQNQEGALNQHIPSSQGQISHGASDPRSAIANGLLGDAANPFGLAQIGSNEAVNPGMLFNRPQTSGHESSYSTSTAPMTTDTINNAFYTTNPVGGSSLVATKSNKPVRIAPRPSGNSPTTTSARPGLGRSLSESRGKKAVGRAPPPIHTSVSTTTQDGPSFGNEPNKPSVRQTGRTSPLKTQHRLSGLSSIPESFQPNPARASVKFTIDEYGRARAETISTARQAQGGDGGREDSRRHSWEASEDESSDDEPIIIPSRNSSFNASFALPDPRKPVGSIFHTSRRSISERSAGTTDSNGEHEDDMDSEAETIMNERPGKGGDALSALKKVVEDRQKRSAHLASTQSQLISSQSSFQGASSSPTRPHTSYDHAVRCVCNRNATDAEDGFMIKCESCEMWLHGKCINITKRSIPRVYICAFCANTTNLRVNRVRDNRRHSTLGLTMAASPMANKTMRSFR